MCTSALRLRAWNWILFAWRIVWNYSKMPVRGLVFVPSSFLCLWYVVFIRFWCSINSVFKLYRPSSFLQAKVKVKNAVDLILNLITLICFLPHSSHSHHHVWQFVCRKVSILKSSQEVIIMLIVKSRRKTTNMNANHDTKIRKRRRRIIACLIIESFISD